MMILPLASSGAPVKPTVSFLGFDQLGFPLELARLHVDRDQLAVERAHVDVAEAERDAAVVGRVRLLRDQILVELLLVRPA